MYRDREKIKIIVEKLKKTGIDNLVAQILEAFEKEYPKLRGHSFPREFLELFWAREYGIVPEMPHYDHDLGSILTQVRARVLLEYRQTILQQTRSVAQPDRAPSLKFYEKDVQKLAEEAWKYLKNPQQELNITDFAEPHYRIDSLLRDFCARAEVPQVQKDITTEQNCTAMATALN